jgi:hypothetical protein
VNLLPDRFDPERDQLHALVIGVGHYAHLVGGALHALRPAKKGEELGQLTSPIASAAAFASWLSTQHSHPHCPLGSLEIALSPSPSHPSAKWREEWTNLSGIGLDPATESENIGRAFLSDIEAAFIAWEQRCDARPGNIAVLYFCGHGLEGGSTLLLPEDFGANPGAPWSNAIDFNMTKTGMRGCRANMQLYILDCCRETPLELRTESMIGARTLKTTSSFASEPSTVVLQAVPLGSSATGTRNAVSDFTSVVIRCLDDYGGTNRFQRIWSVTNYSLPRAINHYARARERIARPVSVQASEERILHVQNHVPKALVDVTVAPATALSAAKLALRGPKDYDRPPAADPWRTEVESGQYRLEAEFTLPSSYHPAHDAVLIHPPWLGIELTV